MKCQLFNFILGHAKMALNPSRRKRIEESLDFDVNTIMRARLKVDFEFCRTTYNVEEFTSVWCFKNVLCAVVENVLYFFPFLYFIHFCVLDTGLLCCRKLCLK